MKMIFFKIGVLLFLFQLLVLFSNAQNLGYLGKRFIFNVDCRVSPTYNYTNYYERDNFLSLDAAFSPNIEFILFNSGTIGVAYNFLKTRFSYDYYDEDYLMYDFSEKNILFEAEGLGFFYKQYFRNKTDYYQAPFGVYGLVRFDIYNCNYFTKNFGMIRNTIYGGRIEFGIDYLVYDRIRLSWGVGLGLSTANYKSDFYTWYMNSLTHQQMASNRFFVNYIFSNRFSIGILAF